MALFRLSFGAGGGVAEQKPHRRFGSGVVKSRVSDQNPTAALRRSSALASSRFRFKFTGER
jgi:hypothetical protein